MMLFLRVAASFALVAVLLWLFARVGAGRLGLLIGGPGRRNGLASLDVVDRRQLTKAAGVAVVRAGSRHFLIGITDGSVDLLAEGDDLLAAEDPDASVDLTDPAGSAGSRDQTSARTRSIGADGPESPRMNPFIALREKTVRRS